MSQQKTSNLTSRGFGDTLISQFFFFLVVDKRSVNAAVKARDLHANETASLSPFEGESVGAAFKAASTVTQKWTRGK